MMRCPFVLQTSQGYGCELMEEIHGGGRPALSPWECDHDGFSICPQYLEMMRQADVTLPFPEDDHLLDFPGIIIRHVNRIGGPRALFDDLIK